MKKAILSVLMIGALALSGCGTGIVSERNSGSMEKSFMIDDFHSVDVGSAFDVQIQKGSYAVSVQIDPDYVDRLIVEKRGGVLYIGIKPGFHLSWFASPIMKATIVMPEIEGLSASGASQVAVDPELTSKDQFDAEVSGASSVAMDVISERVKINLSGASEWRGRVEAKTIKVEASGASDIKVEGSSDDAEIHASGASEFGDDAFSVQSVRAEASGASSVRVKVIKEADLDASGASNIEIYGNPETINQETSGASSIDIR